MWEKKEYPRRRFVALFSFFIGIGVGLILYSTFNEHWQDASPPKKSIPVCFSPEGHCTNHIITAIEDAKASIFVMSYAFTSLPIAQALVEAFERGVNVKVLIDKSQLNGKYSQLSFLSQKGIPLFIDPAIGIAHNKTMIIDDRFVLTGSFNWTAAAESRNAENILFIEDPSLAQTYKENWEKRVSRAKRFSSVFLPPLKRVESACIEIEKKVFW
ncbi:MAG: phospholipase D family protein [Alphaproteobacteria bacterium]|nr:phospholipase D family protein [Alphaproteobacteria bacterium]